jgi:hypothetical protein
VKGLDSSQAVRHLASLQPVDDGTNAGLGQPKERSGVGEEGGSLTDEKKWNGSSM